MIFADDRDPFYVCSKCGSEFTEDLEQIKLILYHSFFGVFRHAFYFVGCLNDDKSSIIHPFISSLKIELCLMSLKSTAGCLKFCSL